MKLEWIMNGFMDHAAPDTGTGHVGRRPALGPALSPHTNERPISNFQFYASLRGT